MTTFAGTLAAAKVLPREVYRATWGATPGGLTVDAITFGALRQDLARGLQRAYEGGLASTGLAYPASLPAVAPSAIAATMDLRIVTNPPGDLTVAGLARKLEELSTGGGGRYVLLRLGLVPAGSESSSQAAAARDRITNEVSQQIEAEAPHYGFLEGLTETAKTVIYIGAGGLVLWFFLQTGAISKGVKEARAIRKAVRS